LPANIRERRTKHALGLDPWAAGVEHEAQGDKRAVRPFLFRAAAGGLGIAGGGALEIGVGEIVERDGDRQSEQVLDAGEQRVLDPVAVAHEQIGGPVETHQRQRFEVHTQQFAEGAALAQPAPGGKLAARCRHPSDQETGDRVALDAVQTETGEA
jgi:hypothetical protein